MKVVAISDTHGLHDEIVLPPGDVLIHAGDFTNLGRPEEIEAFGLWLDQQPHPTKIVVPGNHDLLFERNTEEARSILLRACPEADLLLHEEVNVFGRRFFGSPWQPRFGNWAFNYDRDRGAAFWSNVPQGLDVLITHGPPHNVRDMVDGGARVGCEALLECVERTRPRLHVFGHIHEDAGCCFGQHTTFVNAAYAQRREPFVFDL